MKHRIQHIRYSFQRNKTLVSNFGYLSVLQAFNMLLPLVTYPYLMRVLGPDLFGKVVFAQSVAAYFSIVINFGFNISATKDVSTYREDKHKLIEIFSSVMTIKFFLWAFSLTILMAMVFLIPFLAEDKWLYLFAFGICFNELLFAQWFYQGLEKMQYITIVNLTARITFLILIFTLVRNESHYLLVPLFNAAGSLIGGSIALYLIYTREDVQFVRQRWSKLKSYLKDGLPLFFSRVTSTITEKTNIILIGSIIGMTEVAYYDFAIKILNLCKIPIELLIQTLFPAIVKTQNKLLANRLLYVAAIWGILAALLVTAFASGISLLVGGTDLLPAKNILILISPVIFIYSVSYCLGQPFLVAFGYLNLFSKLIVLANIIYIAGISLLVATNHITVENCILLLILSESINMGLRFIFCYQKQLFAWR